ncbi:alpha/beta hydrolase [Saccharibacillus sp. CPCC 101409]|uniref:alpha/beta hydrolase n=1 Tax=Saccharibacillus sp. CPCC 101409 TaxID=3058041 RepID=UPI002673C613|nr:alpha/beta hydrolase [Saccharibacillus sp. CPCC 101409]MDO3410418.1 alpha/beta hydrolase [Saccharibacillus sp. CPCC 101409]
MDRKALIKLNDSSGFECTTVPVHTVDGLQLNGTFYRGTGNRIYKGTILYLHGGGLIFGHREDLPEPYISLLTESGYGLLALDYPLAPESKLPDIMRSIGRSVEWFVREGPHILNLDRSDYYLMGRSAGGYLALYHAAHAVVRPRGVIAFYGYYSLNDPGFHVPGRHFLQYPRVSDATMRSLAADSPVAASSSEQRYLLYLAVRQRGNWIPFVSGDRNPVRDYELTKQQLAGLPATFIAAANRDPDVPVRQSKMLHKYIPDSELHLVDSAEHDFDRTQTNELGLDVYRKLAAWLDRNSEL